MRYIKTFESFYHEDDMAREIAGFIDCSIERIEFDPKYKDTSMFRGYSIDGRVDDEALEALRAYMENEHGLSITLLEMSSTFLIKEKMFLTEKPLKETCIDWLKENYSGLVALETPDHPEHPGRYVMYRYDQPNKQNPILLQGGDNILVRDNKDGKLWVKYNGIWSLFEFYFNMSDQEIKSIIGDWASVAYDLKGLTILDF